VRIIDSPSPIPRPQSNSKNSHGRHAGRRAQKALIIDLSGKAIVGSASSGLLVNVRQRCSKQNGGRLGPLLPYPRASRNLRKQLAGEKLFRSRRQGPDAIDSFRRAPAPRFRRSHRQAIKPAHRYNTSPPAGGLSVIRALAEHDMDAY